MKALHILLRSFGDRRRERSLERDVRENLPWLFKKYESRVVPTENCPRASDYAVVTVAVGNVLLRFVRGRGELRADIAPVLHASTDWQEVGEAISSTSDHEQVPPVYYRLSHLSLLLQQNLERLNASLSAEPALAPRS
jgi:hypothetical protein